MSSPTVRVRVSGVSFDSAPTIEHVITWAKNRILQHTNDAECTCAWVDRRIAGMTSWYAEFLVPITIEGSP